MCADTWKVPRWNVYQLDESEKVTLSLARIFCKKAFCNVYLSFKFCFCVCSKQNYKKCCIGTCISPMHNIMISPLGSKWSLGTNENKDRAQYLQALKPKTSQHSDCIYSRIWQCQINSHGSYVSQQCSWQASKLAAEFFIFHSFFLKSCSVFNIN